jgi:hypothetical protein
MSMNRLLWMTLLTACLAGNVQASLYSFDFEGISSPGKASDISDYMTGVYGSTVTVTDARRNGGGSWTGNGTDFIWTGDGPDVGGDLEILFNIPITSLSVQGFVFHETVDPDFSVKAYDNTYGGDVENPLPSALVSSHEYSGVDDKTPINISGLTFSGPVSLLVFSDSGEHDVGIDNLQVNTAAVPVPAAALLGLLGLGAAGVKLRRFA